MNYVVPDIHNDNRRLKELLKRIDFGPSDEDLETFLFEFVGKYLTS